MMQGALSGTNSRLHFSLAGVWLGPLLQLGAAQRCEADALIVAVGVFDTSSNSGPRECGWHILQGQRCGCIAPAVCCGFAEVLLLCGAASTFRPTELPHGCQTADCSERDSL